MRLIIASTNNGEEEIVIFTQDKVSKVNELIPIGFTVDYDSTVDGIDFLLPDNFPTEYILQRKGLI